MRVLIVEDNAFNAFCLTRLLQSIYKQAQIVVETDSLQALHYLAQHDVSLAILDGNLGAANGLHCNGPALAHAIWLKHPHIPLIAWSDSETMRHAFASVFKQHKKSFNEYTSWVKVVSEERIRQSISHVLRHEATDDYSSSPLVKEIERLYA